MIVNRSELMAQWKDRLTRFLDLGDGHVGSLGGGRDSLALTSRVELLHQLADALQPHDITPLALHRLCRTCITAKYG